MEQSPNSTDVERNISPQTWGGLFFFGKICIKAYVLSKKHEI
jgi:hypothetical protein